MFTKYTLYIPTPLVNEVDVRGHVSTLTLIAGGRTQSNATGWWQSGSSMIEDTITRIEFLLPINEPSRIGVFEDALGLTANSLKLLGEQSVLVEVTQSEARFI